MTWSYSLTFAADKDKVRFIVGDVESDDQQLQDEEINWVLTKNGLFFAAAQCASALAARYARQANRAEGELRASASQIARAYTQLARDLNKYAVEVSGRPVASAQSQSGKFAVESNTDRVQPFFSRKTGKILVGLDPQISPWPWGNWW